MCHNALLGDEFYEFLLRIDEGLAAETQAGGCRSCGRALHKNRYQRKPRGDRLIGLGKGPHFHLSLLEVRKAPQPGKRAVSGPPRLPRRYRRVGQRLAFRCNR